MDDESAAAMSCEMGRVWNSSVESESGGAVEATRVSRGGEVGSCGSDGEMRKVGGRVGGLSQVTVETGSGSGSGSGSWTT